LVLPSPLSSSGRRLGAKGVEEGAGDGDGDGKGAAASEASGGLDEPA